MNRPGKGSTRKCDFLLGCQYQNGSMLANRVEKILEDTQTSRIRELNDTFRSTLCGGRIFLTPLIVALPDKDRRAVLVAVQSFDEFTRGNAPYGEHDFGSIHHNGETIFWKIDYYDPGCVSGSENPADPAKTVRVLNIMHASDY